MNHRARRRLDLDGRFPHRHAGDAFDLFARSESTEVKKSCR